MNKYFESLSLMLHGLMSKLPGMITCEQLDEFIMAYLDDELPPKEKRVFELHLRTCRTCRLYLDAYKKTIETTGLLKEDIEEFQESAPEELVKAILAAKKA